MKIKKLIKTVVGCPKCHKRTFKRHDNSDGSFYWKCHSCLYETNPIKR